ncbi:glycosyltransferase [Mesorhizobium atlanticum]
MRIAIFSDNFHPEIGGIQDSVEALAKALGQRGHFIDFCVPKYGRRDYKLIDAEPGEVDLGENVRVHRLLSFPFPTSTRQSRLVVPSPPAWLPLLKGPKPDVIHSQTFFGVGLNALFASRLCRVPLVGTNHTAIRAFDTYIRFGMDYVAAYLVWYYNRCDFVTAPSQSVFAELGPDLRPDREVISNPITTDTFHPVTPEKRAELKAEFGLHGPVVTYAGRLAQEKNIETTIRALAPGQAADPLDYFGPRRSRCLRTPLARPCGDNSVWKGM